MTVLEAMKDMHDNEYVYIGSQANFFFIGTKADALKTLPLMDERNKEKLKGLKKKQHDKMVRMESNYRKTMLTAMTRKQKETTKKSFEERYNAATIWMKKLYMLRRLYKNFLDRDVIDVYRRRWVKPLGWIIKCEGSEFGTACSLEEYQRSKSDSLCEYGMLVGCKGAKKC